MQELRRERDDLRAELATVGGREENRPKEDENVGEPFSRFNDHRPGVGVIDGCSGEWTPQSIGFDGGDDQPRRIHSASQFFEGNFMIGSPSSNSTVQRLVGRYGLRGVRVGEASHPGPSILNFGRVRSPRSMGSRFTTVDRDGHC